MDALRTLLSPIVGMINEQIGRSTPARELCAGLESNSIALRIRDTGLALCVLVRDQRLYIVDLTESEPDAVIVGSLIALSRLAGDGGEDLIRDGTVELQGDAAVADDFRRLLRYGRPDLEEKLSAVVGDVAAHGLGEFVRKVGRWSRDARQTVEQNIGEYLTEESRSLPSRNEVDAFRDDVHRLRDDVARVEARIARLESAAANSE
jgi:ubiquinone biosynthesis protein UbiJ